MSYFGQDLYPEIYKRCLTCHLEENDLVKCIVDDCDSHMHERCATTCNRCQKPTCTAHISVVTETVRGFDGKPVGFDGKPVEHEYEVCDICLPTFQREQLAA
jgi:hypothetical protein